MRRRSSAALLLLGLSATSAGADSSPCAEVRTQLRTLASALDVYAVKYGAYPRAEHWMTTLKTTGILHQSFPASDPWGNLYVYQINADGAFDLRSVGPDGARRTGDDQARESDWSWRDCKGRGGC